ncbi:MAG: NADH-quinone oxidoreductase subunit J [Leptolyngbyaceae cyanobacterium SM1_1_3]|nr:NADH-quinone oxidoreductase subunit J [Leptolyngbyaceae cyanobacterium SM1_1_3]NJM85661.1 NADH-quinone oxidoreductase subunit J [Leptolyngbyaceae cyanobacterium RM2_2_21]NJN03291.1 NADH-quinone oxidoreductase subunit J [Leptolyngbyaceae cyanobacterium RM1_1_2]NJO09529.1 NADH-quinone oxidoreductase subunit J [Leptolyngbyaceae cyanobacterium SL_1_1]
MNLAEGVQFVSFMLLAGMMLAAALGVVLLENIVHSAFLLGMVFISISGLYILLNAGFVAAAQILIYVGAVNVLILFGIMLVNKQEAFKSMPNAWLGKLTTAGVCAGLFALLSSMVVATPWAISSEIAAGELSVILIGEHFFSDFLLPFELASVLLLMALVGAIVLARREYLPDELTEPTAEVFKLAERPRELAAAGSAKSDRGG